MQIKLNYTNQEMKNILDGLNNAIIVIQKAYTAALLGCEIPKQLKLLFQNKSFEEIEEIIKIRQNALYKLYNNLLKYE